MFAKYDHLSTQEPEVRSHSDELAYVSLPQIPLCGTVEDLYLFPCHLLTNMLCLYSSRTVKISHFNSLHSLYPLQEVTFLALAVIVKGSLDDSVGCLVNRMVSRSVI